MREVPSRTADLPDPLVRLLPRGFQEVDQQPLQRPRLRIRLNSRAKGHVQRVHDFAVDVELQLIDRGVPDADRPRPLVSGQPVERELRQPPFSARPVHRLQIGRIASDGSEQPRPPGGRLGREPARHQRVQRERRVSEPADAVVPIAHPSKLLGQRCGRGRDNAPGGFERQRLEHDQRTQHVIAPLAVIGALLAPLFPPRAGLLDRDRPFRVPDHPLVGRMPHHQEVRHPARLHGERGACSQVLAVHRHAGPQRHRVRPADSAPQPVNPAHPRDDRSVIEPDDELHPHLDHAAHAFDEANEIGRAIAGRHAVDQAHGAGRGGELGLEHERVAAISAPAGK